MKRVLFFGLFLFFGAGAGAQFPVEVDSFYVFLKYNSILRDRVDWEEVDERFYRDIQQAESLDDTMKCFVAVLESLGDVHSQIYLDNRYYGHYPAFDEATLQWLRPLNDKAIAQTNQIRAEVLEKNVAYLLVPGFQAYDGDQINHLAQELRDQVDRLAKQKGVKAFIIDLRLNGGGNVYPMLTGLSPLLGDKTIGYETGIGGEVVRKWETQDGNFVIGGYKTTDVRGKSRSGLQRIPVAVLIGPVTKSSGSMVAIAFKGRPSTILIGEPTAEGYTTSNSYFQFAPNLFLNFATTFVADRNMNIYRDAVLPEVRAHEGDNFEDPGHDRKIELAKQWLKGGDSGEPITEKYWKLMEIDGSQVVYSEAWEREPHLVLRAEGGKLRGHSGCDTFYGSYELPRTGRIRFVQLTAPGKCCGDTEAEIRLFQALQQADRYIQLADTLFLYRGKKSLLARFEAVYFR